jgi:hypothetical protein
MTTGGFAWAGALMLAANGSITGAGPTDPSAKQELEATGWRPYSYKVGDAYYDYHRLDPLAAFLGMAADTYKLAPHLADDQYGALASGLTLALVHNFNAKSYFTGINNLFDALSQANSDPDTQESDKITRFFGNYLSGYVPGLVNNFNADPYKREARGVIDAFMKRIPGYSEGVDPVRDTLGARVAADDTVGPRWLSPVSVSTQKDDPVQTELARQAVIANRGWAPPSHNIKLPGAPEGGGVDLRQFRGSNGYSAYDRLQELVGTTSIGGQTLHQQLAKLIGSDAYQHMLTDSSVQYEGSRKQAIDQIIGKYRLGAESILLQENPEVKQAAFAAARAAWATKTNGQASGNSAAN